MKHRVFNTADRRKLVSKLTMEYSVDESLFNGYELIGSCGNVWAVSRICLEQDLTGLKLDSVGLQVIRGGRPTIHGIQMFFKSAAMVELTRDEAIRFIAGGKVTKKGRIAAYRGHPVDAAEEYADGIKRKKQT